MRARAILLLISTAALAGSCLLSDEDGDGSNYIAVDKIDEAYKDAQCTHLAMCGVFPTKDACLIAQLQSTGGSVFLVDPNIVGAVYAGHVVYNGGNVKTCIDWYAARSCDKTDESARAFPLACRAFYRGTLAAGETCFVDAECVSQQCSGGSSGSSCSAGVCVGDTAPVIIPAKIGDVCTPSSGCEDGAYCDQTDDMCVALKTSGSACTLDSECAFGLGCVGSTGSRTCGTLPAVGQACNPDGVCRDDGTYCDYNANMCKPLGLAGATCTSSTQCSPYYPCKFATSTGTCTQGPSLGQSCSSSNVCFDAGTYCDFTSATCMTAKADGSLCNSSNECANGYCDFTMPTPICTSTSACF